MPDPSKPAASPSSPKVTESPHLAQLRAREKILQDKIAHRIPGSADDKEGALARAQFHLSQVKEQIKQAEAAKKS
jgi:hypothetical protein